MAAYAHQTEIYYTIILATIFFIVLTVILVISIWRYYARKLKHGMEVLQFDHTLLQTRLEIQESTFQTISQEVHDNSGQLLTLAKLQLNRMDFQKGPEAKEKVDTGIDLITKPFNRFATSRETCTPNPSTGWG